MRNKLQSLIRKAIHEVLSEGETIDVSNPNMTDQQKAALIQQARSATKDSTLGTAKNPVSFVEGELNEMAGANYKLADDYESKLSELPYFNSEKRMKWVNGIVDYLNQEGSSDITKIAREKFDVPQPRIADYARDMIRLGILEPAVANFVPQFMRPETGEEDIVTGPEAMFVGKGNPLSQYFDGAPNADGSEDFTDEDTPEVPEVPNEPEVSTAKEKASDFFHDNDRLYQKLKYAYTASKLRLKQTGKEIGGISSRDFSSEEQKRKDRAIVELPTLVQDFANKIKEEDEETQTIILNWLESKLESIGSVGLYKRIAKALGMPSGSSEPLDEHTKRKLQFYAGIIK
jgi:hypothetical protein